MMSLKIGPKTILSPHSGPPERASRWRRALAAVAVTALAFTGVGILGLAPAAAEDAPPSACVEPQVLDTDGISCVDPAPVEETPEAAACTEPQVLDTDGTTCVDPAPVETPAAALKVDEVVAAAPQGKIAFCHRTASNTNPYVPIETNLNAFYNAGHIDHTGPVWPAVGPDGKWGDIYPPNVYDEDGQNWGPDAQAFIDNGCASEPSNNPGIAVNAESCSYYDGYGWADFSATNTSSDYYYELLLDGVVVDSGWGDEDLSYGTYLDPGTYVVAVRMYDGDPEKEGELIAEVSTDFTLAPCPELGISAQPLTCSAAANGTAVLHFTGLIEGETYEWSFNGPNGASGGASFEATGPTHGENLSGLSPGDYTAAVSWHGISEVVDKAILVDQFPSITKETTFTIVACPALANTGVGDIPTYVNLALLLTILGGTAIAIARQRRETSPLQAPFLG